MIQQSTDVESWPILGPIFFLDPLGAKPADFSTCLTVNLPILNNNKPNSGKPADYTDMLRNSVKPAIFMVIMLHSL